MQIPLLRDIFVIFGLAIAVVLVCHRLRVPPIVGLLITGVLAGPHGLGLVTAVHEVELLAEIGVILLLFTIGIEYSLEALIPIRRVALAGGAIQMALTGLVAFAITAATGLPTAQAVFIGMLVTLSSTAIILRLLQDRTEIDSPHGRCVLGVLIFQDIMIIPMMLLVPILAGEAGGAAPRDVIIYVGKVAAIAAMVVAGARWIVPWLLQQIARVGSNELFVLSVAVICFAVAYATSLVGLSLALGAFVAGLIISESDYAHRALGHAVVFRDVFASFFFVSIGMLLDLEMTRGDTSLILIAVLIVIVLKAVTGSTAVLVLGLPFRIAMLAGLALAQVGEFSLVLMKTGLEEGLITDLNYQRFLAVAILTMVAAPLVLSSSQRVADVVTRFPMPARVRAGRYFLAERDPHHLRDHIVIVGYGVIGAMLAHSARLCDISYVAIEINYDTVRDRRSRGEPIFYGDATQPAVLEKACIHDARIIVVSIPDQMGARRTVELARRLNPAIHVIARTRYVAEMEPLYRLGADEVVPEEVEAAVHIFSSVLRRYGVSDDVIETFGGLGHPPIGH